MKYKLFILILFSFTQDFSKTEISHKSHSIRVELLINKHLPQPIEISDIGSPDAGLYIFYYGVNRKAKDLSDSVWMTVTVHIDSLEHLSFHEMHFKNGKEDKSYMYKMNKYGVIDWAYHTDAPTSEPRIINNNEQMSVTTSNHPIIEINMDSANYAPLKKPDEKIMKMYMMRLKTTLDELSKILFLK